MSVQEEYKNLDLLPTRIWDLIPICKHAVPINLFSSCCYKHYKSIKLILRWFRIAKSGSRLKTGLTHFAKQAVVCVLQRNRAWGFRNFPLPVFPTDANLVIQTILDCRIFLRKGRRWSPASGHTHPGFLLETNSYSASGMTLELFVTYLPDVGDQANTKPWSADRHGVDF